MQDLAVLCGNCHRMVHAKTKWLMLSEMKELLWEATAQGALVADRHVFECRVPK
jgi:hypothetical protein